jgi:CheY-like chemotaxis protein
MMERVALAVDDAPANRDFLERLLKGAEFRVIGAGTGQAALKAVAELDHLSLALVDVKLPDMTGLDLAAHLRQQFPEACIVIATVVDDYSLMETAFSKGCNIFLVKPHGFMELFQRLTTMDIEALRTGPNLIIDQYGPRQFKFATQTVPRVPKQS